MHAFRINNVKTRIEVGHDLDGYPSFGEQEVDPERMYVPGSR